MEYTPAQIDQRIQDDPEMQDLAKNDPDAFLEQHSKIYDSFGYNPNGTPLSMANKVTKGIEDVTGIPRGATKAAASMGISAATTIGGAAMGSVGGPVGTTGGAMLGSMAGERISGALGLTDEPTTDSDVLSLAAPLAGPFLSKTLKGIGKFARSVPGVGTALHQQAAENLDDAMSKVRVGPKDVEAFSNLFDAQIAKNPFQMKTPLLKKAVKKELDKVANSLVPDEPYIKQLNALTKKLSESDFTSVKSLMSTEYSFNKLKQTAPADVWAKLSGVLIDDMDSQAMNPKISQGTREKIKAASQAFKNFVKVNRKAQASSSLDSLTKTAVTEVNGDPNMQRFNKQAFMKKIQYDETLKHSFDPSELEQIKAAVEDVGYIGWGPSGAAQSALQYVGRSGAAGAIGYTVGGGSKGAMAGFAAAGILSHALESQTGRNIVKYLAKNGRGKLDALELKNMLGKVTAGVSAGLVPGINQGDSQGTQAFANQE